MTKKQTAKTPLLEVKDFSLTFRHYEKGLHETTIQAVHKLDLSIHESEIVAVVGASGSGKSLLANAILGILPENAITSGTLNYKGESLTRQKQITLRGKEIALIPQSVNALDPLIRTGKQVQSIIKEKDKQAIQQSIFQKMGLAKITKDLYPFELSGGMSRRVLAATAMVSGAKLIIADEPTPGLDPKALQETLNHLKQLAQDGKGIMFITHDIEAAIELADKIAVFHEGETVEILPSEYFSNNGEKLKHPFTKALWEALPQNDFSDGTTLNPPGKTSKHDQPLKTKSGALDLKHLSYHYPQQPWLFKDLNLSIKPGEIVGLFGSSGSGKSTLAEVIAGYRDHLHGEVLIEGQPLSTTGSHPVQLVWQHPEKAINPRWRMEQVVEEAGPLDTDLLMSLGIKNDWLKRWPSELSGGELQRFCLARALTSKDMHYLIADEMTTMLDAVTQAHIWQSVLELAKSRNIGILAISHDHHLLKRVSDQVINFNKLSKTYPI